MRVSKLQPPVITRSVLPALWKMPKRTVLKVRASVKVRLSELLIKYLLDFFDSQSPSLATFRMRPWISRLFHSFRFPKYRFPTYGCRPFAWIRSSLSNPWSRKTHRRLLGGQGGRTLGTEPPLGTQPYKWRGLRGTGLGGVQSAIQEQEVHDFPKFTSNGRSPDVAV